MVAHMLTQSSDRPLESPRDRVPITSVILPAYNEAAALPAVLADLFAAIDGGYEVLVVDDGSTDGTREAARAFPCRVIRHPVNRGKGTAVRTGIDRALGRYIVIMDADATYPASAIPRIVELLADHDLVRCNRQRNPESMPLVNRLGNTLFDWLLAIVHGLDGSDHLSGLYGLRREALLRMQLESEGFDVEAEIGVKARIRGLRVATFPVDYQPRLGKKKLNPWRDGIVILGRIVALLLLYNPLATFIVPGLLVMLLAMAGASLLGQGPLVTPYFGLSIHSFIVATLGILASFQLMTFGFAAALYRVEAGYRPAGWLVAISARRVRLGGALAGLILAVVGFGEVVRLMARWVGGGLGEFFATREVVLAATVLVLGLQILSAALFISIFAGRLERLGRPAADEDDPGRVADE